ncbi:hypothetical protein LCGC14_2861960 [marine sediment metagenome]|uniref:Uncharacterized protein n=1 Tax=marine sediment metagenome TaxID=412755 RepID=A0A0F9ADP4_9ZZZZ
MAPFFCYLHQGLYVASPILEGCQDAQCIAFAKKEVPPAGICVARVAGSEATKLSRENSNQFHKDMDAYKNAVDQGVEPEMVTVKAANAALRAAEVKAEA